MRMRVPEPCKPQDEAHDAGSARRVRLVSNVVSFVWVRGCPPRPIRHGQPSSRTVADAGERWPALLESVLGATPREFESRFLRHPLTRQYANPGHAFGLGSQGCVVSFVVSFVLRISV